MVTAAVVVQGEDEATGTDRVRWQDGRHVAVQANRTSVPRAIQFAGVWSHRRAAWNVHDALVSTMVDGVIMGQDSVVMAVGHEHTGKQAVFQGKGTQPGVVALAMQVALNKLRQQRSSARLLHKLRVSCYQIMDDEEQAESVSDVLSPDNSGLQMSVRSSGSISVHGLTEVYIKTADECMELTTIQKQCPPRAHVVTTVSVERPNVVANGASRDGASIVGTMTFVLLASPPAGEMFLDDGRARLSRSARLPWLSVINSAISGQRHRSLAPFKDSKIATVLKRGICGDVEMLVVATIRLGAASEIESRDAVSFVDKMRLDGESSTQPTRQPKTTAAPSPSDASRSGAQHSVANGSARSLLVDEDQMDVGCAPVAAQLPPAHEMASLLGALEQSATNESKLKARMTRVDKEMADIKDRNRNLVKENARLHHKVNTVSSAVAVNASTSSRASRKHNNSVDIDALSGEAADLRARNRRLQNEIRDFKLYKSVMENTVRTQQSQETEKESEIGALRRRQELQEQLYQESQVDLREHKRELQAALVKMEGQASSMQRLEEQASSMQRYPVVARPAPAPEPPQDDGRAFRISQLQAQLEAGLRQVTHSKNQAEHQINEAGQQKLEAHQLSADLAAKMVSDMENMNIALKAAMDLNTNLASKLHARGNQLDQYEVVLQEVAHVVTTFSANHQMPLPPVANVSQHIESVLNRALSQNARHASTGPDATVGQRHGVMVSNGFLSPQSSPLRGVAAASAGAFEQQSPMERHRPVLQQIFRSYSASTGIITEAQFLEFSQSYHICPRRLSAAALNRIFRATISAGGFSDSRRPFAVNFEQFVMCIGRIATENARGTGADESACTLQLMGELEHSLNGKGVDAVDSRVNLEQRAAPRVTFSTENSYLEEDSLSAHESKGVPRRPDGDHIPVTEAVALPAAFDRLHMSADQQLLDNANSSHVLFSDNVWLGNTAHQRAFLVSEHLIVEILPSPTVSAEMHFVAQSPIAKLTGLISSSQNQNELLVCIDEREDPSACPCWLIRLQDSADASAATKRAQLISVLQEGYMDLTQGGVLRTEVRSDIDAIHRSMQESVATVGVNDAMAMAIAASPRHPPKTRRRTDVDEANSVPPGTISVDESHEKYELIFCLLLGIQTLVKNKVGLETSDSVSESDYSINRSFSFLSQGTADTPAHPYKDFEFKDFAPKVFSHLRQMANIDDGDYLQSLTNQLVLREISTTGTDGSFFFYSHDIRFVVKTISTEEQHQMTVMLPTYYRYLKRYPRSFLNRILGMYTVREQVFIVQLNVFTGDLPHEVYDLKGSSYGRSASEREKQSAFVILKDNDFRSNPGRSILLAPAARQDFLRQVSTDLMYLEESGIVDYSVLLGVHFRDRQDEEPGGAGGRLQTVTETPRHHHVDTSRAQIEELQPPSYQQTVGCEVFSSDANQVYYLGIIDILTPFNLQKKHVGPGSISLIDPKKYAGRLRQFIEEKTES